LKHSFVFDMPHAQKLVRASQDFLQMILPPLTMSLTLKTVVDAGCGIGHYAQHLSNSGYEVVGFDGRQANVDEARRRYPHLNFQVGDIEDPAIKRLGRYDLVMCFGLLYHLENPFRAIRNMRALARKAVLVSTICIPERYPLLQLISEGEGEDQALRFVALYPSEACVIKMFHRADFPFVYRFAKLPDHEDFRSTVVRRRLRSVILASIEPLDFPWLLAANEVYNAIDPWETPLAKMLARFSWSQRIITMPWPEKVARVQRLLRGSGGSQ
jgi:SAM-dependent methyltransferase